MITIVFLNCALLSFLCGLHEHGMKKIDNRAKKLGEYFKSLEGVDIIAMAETFDSKGRGLLLKKLKDIGFKHQYEDPQFPFAFLGVNSGLCMVSKKKVNDISFTTFNVLAGDSALSNKGFIRASFKIKKGQVMKNLVLYFTHMNASKGKGALGTVYTTVSLLRGSPKQSRKWTSDMVKIAQLRQMKTEMQKDVANGYHVMMIGDTNLDRQNDPDERTYDPIAKRSILLADVFKEVFQCFGGEEIYTFHNLKDPEAWSADEKNHKLIDHALNMTPINTKATSSYLRKPLVAKMTDHKAMKIQIELK
jgi:hypothetical protein